MRAPLAPIAPVLLGVLIAEVALGMLTTLIPLSLSSRGVAAGTIGFVGSGYFLGFLIGTLTCARLVRAVGHIRAFTVFAALGADCALLMTTTHSPWVWTGLRLVMGWQMSGLFLVAGIDCRVHFATAVHAHDEMQLVKVEEGRFNGTTFIAGRLWNGDETDNGLNFGGKGSVLRVTLGSF